MHKCIFKPLLMLHELLFFESRIDLDFDGVRGCKKKRGGTKRTKKQYKASALCGRMRNRRRVSRSVTRPTVIDGIAGIDIELYTNF